MAAPTFDLSEQNGASTGTTTNTITSIVFASADLESNTASLATTDPITVPGSGSAYSFEKYNRWHVTGVASNSLSAFGVYFSATAPEDSSTVSTDLLMYFGVTATYTAPVSTVSSVATTLCSTVTTSPGTTLTAPANTVGAFSEYVVQQLKVSAGAIGGNMIWPSPWLSTGYVYS